MDGGISLMVVATAIVKLGVTLGTVTGIITGVKYFHTFEVKEKPKNSRGGNKSSRDESAILERLGGR